MGRLEAIKLNLENKSPTKKILASYTLGVTDNELLETAYDVYVLKTSEQFHIFFRLEPDRIVLLDIASEATIRLFSQASGVSRSNQNRLWSRTEPVGVVSHTA